MPNTTCPVHVAPVDPVPFLSNGNINFKAHEVGWIVCGFFSSVATVASLWLIWKHLTYYTCPQQQRHIIRMLLMVPIYAIISTLSYIFYTDAIYFATIRDCYEAVVITSFFYLLLQYVGDTTTEQHEVFRQVKLKKWFWPLGSWKYRPDGLHFLWLMKIGILQYAIVQPICTLTAVGLQYYGLYCLESWQPYFGHIWLSLVINISITIAMYNVIQIYLPITNELKPYKPVLKFLAIKCIVFFSFWQDSFLSLLIYFKAIKATNYFTTADIQVGLSALLVTFEMMIFAFVHVKAFTYRIYRPQDRNQTTRRWRAMLDVMDFRDWWYEMQHTSRYVKARSKGKDYTIVDDIRWQKYMHLEKAMGRNRTAHMNSEQEKSREKQIKSYWKESCEGETNEVEKVDELESRRGNLITTTCSLSAIDSHHHLEEEENDPEKSCLLDEDLQKDDDEEKKVSHTHSSSLLRLPYDDPLDVHPELTQYHQGKSESDPQLESQQRIRKDGRLRRDVSLGIGAWWRVLKERVSGCEVDDKGDDGVEAQEKSNMLAKEDKDVEKEAAEATISRHGDNSMIATNCVHREDSPLSLFMRAETQLASDAALSLLNASTRCHERQVHTSQVNMKRARYASTTADLQMHIADNNVSAKKQVFMNDVSRYVPMLTRAVSAVKSVNPSISTATSPTSTNSPQGVKSLVSTGPKGKSISLVLPPPLSGSRSSTTSASVTETFTTARQSQQGSIRTHQESEVVPRRITIVELKGKGRMEDDPEKEPISRVGYVVPGGQSLNQANQLESQVKAREKKNIAYSDVINTATTERMGSVAGVHVQDRGPPRSSQLPLISERKSPPKSSQLQSSIEEQTHLAEVPSTSQDFIPLPAPSQMIHIDHRQDAFAAAVSANSPAPKITPRLSLDHRYTHATSHRPPERRSRHSIEVGSIITRQDMMNIRTPQPHWQNYYPSHAVGSRTISYHHAQPPQQTRPRYSTGSLPRPTAQVFYHRYTGEPLWLTSPQSSMPTRVQRQQRQYEAPPGYHFDFID